jgi:hypothetical protein
MCYAIYFKYSSYGLQLLANKHVFPQAYGSQQEKVCLLKNKRIINVACKCS